MSHTPLSKLAAIDSNLDSFLRLLPGLMAEHEGEYALLRYGQVVAFFPEAIDAQIAGNQRYPDGVFSFQRVTEVPEELGAFTYALSRG
jgi:hypothetical protein